MKLSVTILLLCVTAFSSAQVGIGTTTPDSSTILDISSTDKGILIPRLTSTNRNAMPNVSGMLVYDETLKGFYYNDGTQWHSLTSSLTQRDIIQTGTYNVGSTTSGQSYYNVTYSQTFSSTPSVAITLREGTGTNATGYDSMSAIYIANSSTTGFTIVIKETSSSNDVYIDWIATQKTQ